MPPLADTNFLNVGFISNSLHFPSVCERSNVTQPWNVLVLAGWFQFSSGAPSSNLGVAKTSSKHIVSHQKSSCPLHSDPATKRSQIPEHKNATCSEVLGERQIPAGAVLCLLVASYAPSHTRRIPNPTPWLPVPDFLAAPGCPASLLASSTPGLHLHPELQVGLWRRH